MSSYQETAYEHLCRSAAYIRPDMPYRASDILSSLMGSLHRQHPGELGTAWSEIQTHTIGNAKIDGGLARMISHMLDRACACHQSICSHRWGPGRVQAAWGHGCARGGSHAAARRLSVAGAACALQILRSRSCGRTPQRLVSEVSASCKQHAAASSPSTASAYQCATQDHGGRFAT